MERPELEPSEPAARRDPKWLIEIFDPRQPHALAPIGSEGKKRDRIVRRVKRVAKQRDGQALHFEYAFFPSQLRSVDEYDGGEVAQPRRVAVIDATLWCVPCRQADGFFDQRVNIEIMAFGLAPQSR